MKIRVKTVARASPYTIEIRPGILAEVGPIFRKRLAGGRIFILTNDRVGPLHYGAVRESLGVAGFDHDVITVPDGERYKTHSTYRRVIDRLAASRADRHSILAVLGGGVVGDLGGLVAATYMRGITLVHIPTTLVAQIDSSIGGKVAIDHHEAKNLIGTFYNPALVLTDPEVLATLRKRDYRNGLFEAIKTGLVCNRELFEMIADNLEGISRMEPGLTRQMIIGCAREKVRVVERDPFDRGRRMILNFGHTVGHALETSGRYSLMSHGEGVGLGMLVALRLSQSTANMNRCASERAYELTLGLLKPNRLTSADPEDLWRTISLDKKRKGGKARFVLLKDIGKPVIKEISKRAFLKVLEEI